MSEYRKEISIGAVVGIIAALGVGLFAVTTFSLGGLHNTATPRLLLGVLSTENVSCSLGIGVCNMTIVNSGTDPSTDVVAINCSQSVISSSNGSNITWHIVTGTTGGQATNGIPAGTRVVGTCAIATSELQHQPAGSFASGVITVKLVNKYYSYPPGSETTVGFESTWS